MDPETSWGLSPSNMYSQIQTSALAFCPLGLGGLMARFKFMFCHYRISVGDDELDTNAQIKLITENQGSRYGHGRERDGFKANALIMTPSQTHDGGLTCLSWWVGYQPGYRTLQTYDRATQRIGRKVEPSPHIKSSLVVAVPELRAIAFQDKARDENIPARTAISALRSIITEVTEGDGVLDVTHATDADVRKALDTWELTEYLYTVRPLNPISGSDAAERRTAAYKSENIGKESGRIWPQEGETMRRNDGPIAETEGLVDVGYGQNGLRGITPDGHSAHIPKPAFHMERDKNLAERQKPRYMRVEVDIPPDENDMVPTVAQALKGFFG